MKFLFIFAVMYFALPMMTPETTTTTTTNQNRNQIESEYFYRTIVADKNLQEKSLNRFVTETYQKSKEVFTATASVVSMLSSLVATQTKVQPGKSKNSHALTNLQAKCDPAAVEGEDVYDLERSITMLYNISPSVIRDSLS